MSLLSRARLLPIKAYDERIRALRKRPHRLETGGRILVVARDHALRTMVSCLLSISDYEVRDAADSSGAWTELVSGFFPDVLISGYERPGTDEEVLFRYIRYLQVFQRAPILVMASADDLGRQMEWRAAGVTCWIIKPFSSDQLLEIVGMVLHKEKERA